MTKNTYILLFFFLIVCPFYGSNKPLIGPKTKNKITVHIISIGIKDGNAKIFSDLYKNCENDAVSIATKIEYDKAYAIQKKITITRSRHSTYTDQNLETNDTIIINKHLILGKNATLPNIKIALKDVIQKSSSNDFFYFYFAGTSLHLQNIVEVFFTYNQKNIQSKNLDDYEHLSVLELASFINQIAAKNQIVISEAGMGKSFAQELQVNLFELNPNIAINTERNRIVLTTLDMGYDSSQCNKYYGPLTNMILNSGNIFEVFHNYHYYEYLLNKLEVECSPKNIKYYFIKREEDYKLLLKNHLAKINNTRGATPKEIKTAEEKSTPNKAKAYALMIGTNVYNKNQQDWNDLKNPINDANAVGKLLEEKYHVNTIKLYNEPKDKIISEIIAIKKIIQPNDLLMVFIAGHGYYSKNFSQGYIVTTDSASLNNDFTLNTYLPLSTLNNLLDGFVCKPILTILDVCYGASFEINNADLVVENYFNTQFDDGIEKFIQNTHQNYAPIMLASGEGEVPDFWKNSVNHSPFATKLILALEKEKQFISPGKLFSYVKGNTTKPILKKFGKHENAGDFLLKVN